MSLRLASPPSLDVALLLMQGEHLEAVALMIESGAVDLMELEELKIKIGVYAEIGSSTRILLAPGTREKLHHGSVEVKQMIQAWRGRWMMNVLSIVWPGFSAARRIARNPIRFLVAGLEACIMFPLEHAPWGLRWIAGLVMFFLVFICCIAALTWPVAMVVVGWAAHSEVLSLSHAQNWAVWITILAYFALLTSKVME